MNRAWTRFNRKPCIVCGHVGWCSASADGAIVHCMRSASDHPAKSGGGWLHFLDKPVLQKSVAASGPAKLTPARLAELHREYQSRLVPGDVAGLASKLGAKVNALHCLGIGQDGGSAFTFPMFDGAGKLIGFNRRFPNGRKVCLTGSRLGLFIPTDLSGSPPLLICEGASDTAAALTLGYDAIGLPSAGNGFDHAVDYIVRHKVRHVVMVADLDEGTEVKNGDVIWPGIESALKLSERIMQVVPDLHLCLPPDGTKDLRQWIGTADATEIKDAIGKAPKVHPAWLRLAWSNVEQNRQRRRIPDWSRQAAALLATVDDDDTRADLREQFEERAGIVEFDGYLPRDEAERIAYEQVRSMIGEVAQ